MKIKNILLILSIFLCAECSYAETFNIVPDESTIKGSIRYVVVGKYVAEFEEYKGYLKFDLDEVKETGELKRGSVKLTFKTASIKSRFPRLDKIVKSKKLLDAGTYPDIIFEGRAFNKLEDNYEVRGVLDMHGVKEPVTFPFQFNLSKNDGVLEVHASGSWEINRKDFGIIWNKALDKGGVLVSDTLVVDWDIVARTE